MRYFIELSYNGTAYSGWQKQPNALSVQEVIETSLSTIIRQETSVVGCGRTDAGVHARQYFLHFDHEPPLPKHFMNRLNKILPADIAFYHLREMSPDAHARFDAKERAYEYHLVARKDPFTSQTAFHFPQWDKLNMEKMQSAAALLLDYSAFYPFCKSKTDVKTMNCDLRRSEWEILPDQQGLVFHIAANRFLRGMVRLVVGMCLNVGMGKLKLETVKTALDKQERMVKSLSAPPHGLFLTEVDYEGEQFFF